MLKVEIKKDRVVTITMTANIGRSLADVLDKSLGPVFDKQSVDYVAYTDTVCLYHDLVNRLGEI